MKTCRIQLKPVLEKKLKIYYINYLIKKLYDEQQIKYFQKQKKHNKTDKRIN